MPTTIAEKTDNSNRAFRLKGNLFTLTVLQLLQTNTDFTQQLKNTIKQAPKFFQNAPIVIDLNEIENSIIPPNLAKITQGLKEQGLIPVGVRGGNEAAQQEAREAGLAILANSSLNQSDEIRAHSETKMKTKPNQKLKPKSSKRENSTKQPHSPTKVVTQPVRSGQQIYAKGSDLIILSSVSHGAEILADGHIHVYGPLRGRALAGILGDSEASIFCQSLDAEMVSIAGRYLVNDQLDDQKNKGPLHIYLEDDRLLFADL